jgi:putative ABC transport system permease protein
MTVFVRTAGEPMALLPALRAEVQRLDKNLPLFDVRTLDSHLGIAFAQERTYATLIGGFALLAMLLAAVGLYGVMSYAVSQRTREIGIRMALGANQRDALFLVLSRSLKLGGLGIGAGLIGALALTQLVSSMLYGVSHTDAATFAFVAALLTVVLLAASYVPAYRATKVDPMIALRYE